MVVAIHMTRWSFSGADFSFVPFDYESRGHEVIMRPKGEREKLVSWIEMDI